MVDRFIKITSLGGTALIFCGFLKLKIYYAAFDIDISEFITIGEIITSFLDDMNIILMFLAFMAFQSFPFSNFVREKQNLSETEFQQRRLGFAYRHRQKFFWSFLFATCLLLFLVKKDFLSLNYFIIYLIIILVSQAISFRSLQKSKDLIKYDDTKMFLNLMIMLLMAIYLLAQYDIRNASEIKCSIVTSDQTYVCGNGTKNIYVGKTDNYAFIKLKNLNKTISIPVSEIKELSFISPTEVHWQNYLSR